jgi:iron complex transport system substrate-binding protein
MAGKGQRLALVVIAAAVLLAVSCGREASEDEALVGFPITIERADGQELTFEAPPQRIVSLSPGHTEVLFAIGAGDQVIAVDAESDYPVETETLTKLDAVSPDVEALAELQPDLVVVMAGPEGVVESLDQRGLPVLLLDLPRSVNELFDQIDELGDITGHVERSDALVDTMDSGFLAVLEKVGARAGPRVYHELGDDLTTASANTFIGEVYLILNAISIADEDQEPYPKLTLDEIVEADPAVIIVAHSGASAESVKARPGWEGISAVKNGQVFAVDPEIINRPGPRLMEGLETLAGLFYPDLFPSP